MIVDDGPGDDNPAGVQVLPKELEMEEVLNLLSLDLKLKKLLW